MAYCSQTLLEEITMENAFCINKIIDVNNFLISGEDIHLVEDMDGTMVIDRMDDGGGGETLKHMNFLNIDDSNKPGPNLRLKEKEDEDLLKEYCDNGNDDLSASVDDACYYHHPSTRKNNSTAFGNSSGPYSPTRRALDIICNDGIVTPEKKNEPISYKHAAVTAPDHPPYENGSNLSEIADCYKNYYSSDDDDENTVTSGDDDDDEYPYYYNELDGLCHRSLQKMVTNMSRSDESRAILIKQRQCLPDVYGSREREENDLLSGRRSLRLIEMELTRTNVFSFVLDNLAPSLT